MSRSTSVTIVFVTTTTVVAANCTNIWVWLSSFQCKNRPSSSQLKAKGYHRRLRSLFVRSWTSCPRCSSIFRTNATHWPAQQWVICVVIKLILIRTQPPGVVRSCIANPPHYATACDEIYPTVQRDPIFVTIRVWGIRIFVSPRLASRMPLICAQQQRQQTRRAQQTRTVHTATLRRG